MISVKFYNGRKWIDDIELVHIVNGIYTDGVIFLDLRAEPIRNGSKTSYILVKEAISFCESEKLNSCAIVYNKEEKRFYVYFVYTIPAVPSRAVKSEKDYKSNKSRTVRIKDSDIHKLIDGVAKKLNVPYQAVFEKYINFQYHRTTANWLEYMTDWLMKSNYGRYTDDWDYEDEYS